MTLKRPKIQNQTVPYPSIIRGHWRGSIDHQDSGVWECRLNFRGGHPMVKRVRFNLKQLMEKTTTATTTTTTITTTTTEPRPDASTYGMIMPLLRQGWLVIWWSKELCIMVRLNSLKNTNFRLYNKKSFLTHSKIVFGVTDHFCIKWTFWKNAFFCPKDAFFEQKRQFDPLPSAAQRRCQGTFFSGGNFTPIF